MCVACLGLAVLSNQSWARSPVPPPPSGVDRTRPAAAAAASWACQHGPLSACVRGALLREAAEDLGAAVRRFK